jgi:riboflavin synthase alpha subunit
MSHNGVCLTVVEIAHSVYKVIAVIETLEKTNPINQAASNK